MRDLLKDCELELDLSSDIQLPYQHHQKQTVPKNNFHIQNFTNITQISDSLKDSEVFYLFQKTQTSNEYYWSYTTRD